MPRHPDSWLPPVRSCPHASQNRRGTGESVGAFGADRGGGRGDLVAELDRVDADDPDRSGLIQRQTEPGVLAAAQATGPDDPPESDRHGDQTRDAAEED